MTVSLPHFSIGQGQPFTVICGPCVIESEDSCLFAAEALVKIVSKTSSQLIFKSSFDKANRSSIHSFRGPGLQDGLRILQKVKETLGIPVTTDIHLPDQAKTAAEVCDIVQIPAFLSRQTDLLVAAAATKTCVNVKKGQFMAPQDMGNVVDKLRASGADRIVLTDRGVSFGYHNLVSDMRAIPIMQRFQVPVCFDATHSVQLPGGLGSSSGGQREFIPILAQAAVAAGANMVFMEAHPDPENAKSDAASQLPFASVVQLVLKLERLYQVVQG